MSDRNEIWFNIKLSCAAIIALFALCIGLGTFKIVDPGERGVVVRMGTTLQTPMDEGINMKLPFADNVEIWVDALPH